MRGLRSTLRARAHTGNRTIHRTGVVVAGAAVALAGLPGLAAPAAAAGNGMIAYTAGDVGDGPEIPSAFAVSPAGGTPKTISAGSVSDAGATVAAFPVYSPDGKKVAFSRGTVGEVPALRVYVANADGSNPVPVTQPASGDAPARLDVVAGFSPDGTKLAFTRQLTGGEGEGGYPPIQTWIVDVATKAEKRLAEGVDRAVFGLIEGLSANGNGVFSADGKQVVLTSMAEESVYRANVSTGAAQRVTDPAAGAAVGPQFSPDGKRIAFGAQYEVSEGWECGVFTVGATATNAARAAWTPVTTFACDDSQDTPLPTYSPNGKWIAFGTAKEDPDPEERQLRLVPASGGTVTPLTAVAEGAAMFPVWSPDSTKVAFAHMVEDPETDSTSTSLRVVSVSDPTHAAGPPLASGSMLVPSSWQRLPDATKPPVSGLHVCNEKAPVPAGYKLISGTKGKDRLVGTKAKELIRGLGGDDVIIGKGGGDILCGNGGDDVIRAGSGDDRLYGGNGNDDLRGSTGTDYVSGGQGDDVLRGGAGADVLTGNQGNDRLLGQKGADEIHGGKGTDTGVGGPGKDTFFGVENKTQ